MKRQIEPEVSNNDHSLSNKRVRLTNVAGVSNKVFIKVPDYETEQFEDVNFLEEEMPIEITKFEVQMDTPEVTTAVSTCLLEFPLTTIVEVNELEENLNDPKSPYRRKIIDLMLGSGFESKDYKYAIRTFFRVVFERALMARYCWFGSDAKHSLKNLINTLEFFESTVRKWAPTWKKDDFSMVVRNYIRNCPAKATYDVKKSDSELGTRKFKNEG